MDEPGNTGQNPIPRNEGDLKMARFWKYMKTAVLVWGFISLPILLFAVTMIVKSNLERKEVVNVEPEPLQKTSGEVSLRVTQGSGEDSGILIDISRGTMPLTRNYRLPTKKYGLNGVRVTDASIVGVNDSDFRIVLYSAVYDCDRASGHYVWFLTWKNQLELVTMINLSDLYKAEGKELVLLGTKFVFLPSFDTSKSEQVAIPVEVQIGDRIKILPTLNHRGIDVIRSNFGKEIDTRIAKLTSSENEALLKEYKKAREDLKEILSERTLTF